MKQKNSVLASGFVLWVLGVLVGAGAGDILPGESYLPAGVVLGIALLASVGNFAVLFKKVQ